MYDNQRRCSYKSTERVSFLKEYDNLLLLFYLLQATKCTNSCYWCLKVEDNSYILLFEEYRNMIHRKTKSCHERDSSKNVILMLRKYKRKQQMLEQMI